jgi:hypothetical protein
MSWNEEAITYLRKHREYVARDLEGLRAGQVKITEGSNDGVWIGRYQRQIGHLDQIIEKAKLRYQAARPLGLQMNTRRASGPSGV